MKDVKGRDTLSIMETKLVIVSFFVMNTNYLTRHSIFGHEYEISNLVQAFVHM